MLGRAGGAVRPRDAEQEERRRERPQQEVLHRGLVRVPAPGDAGQDVERQRQDLERQEHQDQVGRGRDQRHPGGGEQDQRVELPAIRIARTREVVRAEQQPHPGDPEQQQPRDHREAIDRDHPAHHGRRAVPVPQRERRQRGRDQAGERQREVPQPLGLRSHRLVEQAEDRHAAEEQLGEDRRELELRRGDHGSAPVRLHDARGADVGDVIGRHVRDHSLRRGIDAVGEELREDAEDQQQRQDRRQDQHLAEVHVGQQRVLLVDRAVRHPLVGPEQVDRRQDDRDRGQRTEPLVDRERPEDHQELADEVVESRQPDGGEHREQERAGQPRHDDREAAHLPQIARMGSLVDHPDQQEQRAGRQAVVHHLQDAARHALVREREDAQDHEPQVRHGGVRDQPLDVRLDQRHHGAVDDPDQRQDRDGRGEVLRRFGEQLQVEADQPVRADLQQDACQQHRAGGGRLGVRVGQPRVQREQRHLHGERDEEREEEPARGARGERARHGRELLDVERPVADRSCGPRIQEQDARPTGTRSPPSCRGRT